MRRTLAGIVVAILLVSCADRGSDVGASVPDGFRRIVRQQQAARVFECAWPTCPVATLASWSVRSPVGSGDFQLVITLTFSYRLSVGDASQVGISVSCPLSSNGTPVPCPTPTPTRTHPLASHAGAMTTTVTWGLPPSSGPGSIVYFMATLEDRDGDGFVRLVTSRVTAVFEMWPR